MSSNLKFYVGYSLVDITATGIVRDSSNNNLERNQQRNWETLLQCIGLRTQPQNIHPPVQYENIDLSTMNFGDLYTGEQHVWSWQWTVELDNVYDLPGLPLGGLMQDLEQVPIITGLNETAKFMLPIFYPYGTIKNIYITQQDIE